MRQKTGNPENGLDEPKTSSEQAARESFVVARRGKRKVDACLPG
jgi:hypothetical protein